LNFLLQKQHVFLQLSTSAAVIEDYGMYHPNMLEGTYIHMFEVLNVKIFTFF
jgi:hypothetical protein